jgi:hypothetical protein
MLRRILLGATAGAAGTTALNALIYADMALRGRPARSSPAEVVERAADEADVVIAGDGVGREDGVTALGAVSGIAVGVGIGAAYGLVSSRRPPAGGSRGSRPWGAAMAASDLPATRLGVTSPSRWTSRTGSAW